MFPHILFSNSFQIPHASNSIFFLGNNGSDTSTQSVFCVGQLTPEHGVLMASLTNTAWLLPGQLCLLILIKKETETRQMKLFFAATDKFSTKLLSE